MVLRPGHLGHGPVKIAHQSLTIAERRKLAQISGLGTFTFSVDGLRVGLTSWDLDGISFFELAPPSGVTRFFAAEPTRSKEGDEWITYNQSGSLLAHSKQGAIIVRDPTSLNILATLPNQTTGLLHSDPQSDGFLMSKGGDVIRSRA